MKISEYQNETSICILHTNDTHSYLDDFAKRAYLVKKIREENSKQNIDTFLFDCGDALTGSIYFFLYEGEKEAELMNLLAYDAMTLGNHEFDRGSALLANFLEKIQFPVVSANIDVDKDRDLHPYYNKKLFPFIIKELCNGEKIAVIGLTTETTPDSAAPSKHTIFSDPIQTASKMIKEVKCLGVKKIIILSHLGKAVDQQLASEVDGIDVILGGHSHDLLEEPIVVHREASQTIIVQAGEYGKYLGEVIIKFSGNGEVKSANSRIYRVDTMVEEDHEVKIIIDKIKKEKDQTASNIIGEIATDLVGDRESLSRGKSSVGNLVTDAFYHKAKEHYSSIDVAVMNGGGIRSSISKGRVTTADIIRILPFSKTLMILEATGEEIKEALEYGSFPQVSQLKVVYNMDNPLGSRITDILIARDNRWIPLQAKEKYAVATNSFVSAGRDNFIGFKKAKVIYSDLDLDITVLSDFIATCKQPIRYEFKQRVFYDND